MSTDVDAGDVVERAEALAERYGLNAEVAALIADADAGPMERLRAWLAGNKNEQAWVLAADPGAARAWAKDHGVDRIRIVTQAANLFGVTGGFVIVLPGATEHREWRRIKGHLAYLRGLDAAVVVEIEHELPAGDFVGCVRFDGDGFTPLPAVPAQGDVLLVRDASRGGAPALLGRLDRPAVERLIRVCQAFLNAEPLPDPVAEEAARIRQLIAETGDPFARGGTDG